ncbi:uncharacterized protein UV8b_04484 [Ustilaginoidea virens]|uniref:CREG-like beta-barrel domain-containing protein n=1 Tax=Ustilaginoidea virens TaxID=1159556 RepID=A0A8E5HRV2_USTVR|nr:uncharacterized protein UV8b_04484 [Ustilaginoidea virens]QUC20243.1 hypothetical protein UV8b_04484 [Ustilaginoidea virens]
MRLLDAVVGFFGVSGTAQPPLSILDNSVKTARIPTSRESAVMGRRVLALSKLGTLSTVFPNATATATAHGVNNHEAHDHEVPPSGMGGQPVGLMDYVADCEEGGNPTILAIKVATNFKNVRAGSNITLAMRWQPPYAPAKRISILSRLLAHVGLSQGRSGIIDHPALFEAPDTVPYSAANLPRFALFGYLEPIQVDDEVSRKLATCYTTKHPDATFWLPGNRIHDSEWMRLVVTHIHWIGGFGDRAYIGWIPAEDWKKVKRDDWEAIRLPGEKKGWNEWSIGQSEEL